MPTTTSSKPSTATATSEPCISEFPGAPYVIPSAAWESPSPHPENRPFFRSTPAFCPSARPKTRHSRREGHRVEGEGGDLPAGAGAGVGGGGEEGVPERQEVACDEHLADGVGDAAAAEGKAFDSE